MLLKILKTPTFICKACLLEKERNSSYLIMHETFLCESCYEKMAPNLHFFRLMSFKGLSIFPYDEFIKEKLFLLKGCGDIELAPIFLERFKFWLKLFFHDYYIVCVPSWKEDDEKRGFNHVYEIFKTLKLPHVELLSKSMPFKQSDSTLLERQMNSRKFIIDKRVTLKSKKILLVDDIMTSGATLKACATLINEQKPEKLYLLTVAYVEKRKNKAN